MHWQNMTMEDFAAYTRSNGTQVKKIGDVWWAEVRPCFYRPLAPLATVDPGSCRYPVKSFAGGVLHPVPHGAAANSHMNMFVYSDLKNYSLDGLNNRRRKLVEQGIRNFSYKPLTDVQEFEKEAFDVFVAFHKRVNYSYKKERLQREKFAKWARLLFQFPQIRVAGSYHRDRLLAVDISFRVGEVILCDTMFSTQEGLDLKVTDFIYHRIREAAVGSDAKYILVGFPTGKKSLDDSKVMRGCKLLQVPSYHRFNPVAMLAARQIMKKGYAKLMAIVSLPAADQDRPLPEFSAG